MKSTITGKRFGFWSKPQISLPAFKHKVETLVNAHSVRLAKTTPYATPYTKKGVNYTPTPPEIATNYQGGCNE